MTLDPVFDFNNNLADISNIHDLTDRTDMFPCQDGAVNIEVPGLFNRETQGSTTNLAISYVLLGALGAGCLLVVGVVLGGGVVFLVRRKQRD